MFFVTIHRYHRKSCSPSSTKVGEIDSTEEKLLRRRFILRRDITIYKFHPMDISVHYKPKLRCFMDKLFASDGMLSGTINIDSEYKKHTYEVIHFLVCSSIGLQSS